MRIDHHTAVYGVVGFPLGHTLSPIMHNAAIKAEDLNAVYLAFETEDINGCIQGMRAFGIKGLSVTLPYKSVVISYLDEVDPLAEEIGAVNTIVNDRGRLVGYNTDAQGALKALSEVADISGRHCLLVGAGGAARAIGFILRRQGLHLTVVNRSSRRGEELAGSLECAFVPLEQIGTIQGDILVQTTPIGMYPAEDQCVVPSDVLKEGMVVMDIIYNPIKTKLLLEAERRGCKTIDGVSMFIYQGAEQFRLWTGLEAPMSAMTNAVIEALEKPT